MAKYELSLTVENANLEVTPEGPVTLSVLELVGPRGETGPTGPQGPAGTTLLSGLSDVDTSNAQTGRVLASDGDNSFSFIDIGTLDTLDDVTSRGSTTTNDISVGAVTATSLNTHAIPSGTGTLAKTSDIPTNNNQLTNGAGYVTEAEAQAAISVVDTGGDGSLAYANGTITYTGPSAAEVRAHLSAGGDLSYDSNTGIISFTERTDAEVRQLFSVTGDLSYNNTTGVFSFTERTDAEVRGLVSASGDLSYNSTTGVFSFTERTDTEVQALITGGTGVTVTNGVVAIGQAVNTNSDVTFNDVTVSGDLTVNGTTTTIDSTTVAVADSLFKLAKDNTADSLDAGWYGVYNDGTEKYAGIARDASDGGKFILYDGLEVEPTTTVDTSGTGFNKATLVADIEGNVTGNSNTASTLATARTISLDGDVSGSTSFDGSGNVTITATVADDSHNHLISNVDGLQSALDGKLATTATTDDVSEGSANLYYTDARANSAFDTRLATKDTGDLSEGTNLYYTDARADARVNLQTGANLDLSNKTTSDLTEGTNLYYTAARFDTAFAAKDTDDLSEGTTNLYYTDARANAAIDARVDEAFVNALNVEAASADTLTFTVKNSTGSILEKGSVVYVSGLNGNTPEVSLARANSSSTMPAFGLVEADIANAADGVVTTFGSLAGLNVADFGETGITFSLGDTVYVSSSEAGKLTNVAPTGEANLIQNIGKIERASPTTNMTIKVGGAGRTNATPNLNDGNFFLGNASNQAVSADFTTSVRGEISATDGGGDGSFSYDSGTGVFTYTGPSATEVRNHFTGGTGVTITNGEIAIGQAVGTTDNVEFGNATLSGYLAGPATFTIDPAAVGDNTGKVVIAGDLQVDGTTTTVNSTTVEVSDKNVVLGADATADTQNHGAGITVSRPDSTDAGISWDETSDEWDITNGLDVAGNIKVSGTVDGRDVAADGTKLDGIEANADVTDAANVTAAGALMDNEVTNLAQVKAFDSADYATAAQGATADTAVQPNDSPTFGTITADGLSLGDNEKIQLGASNDLQIYAVSGNSYIQEGGSGSLSIRAADLLLRSPTDENYLVASNNGAVTLYYDDAAKFATTSTGVDVTGNLIVPTVYGGTSVLPTLTLQNTSGNSNHSKILVGNVVASDNGGISLYTAGASVSTERVRISGTSGNVGIGNNNPATALDVTGTITADGLNLGDNEKVQLGASNDLQIYHDGVHSYIADVGDGVLFLRGNDNVVLESNSGSNYFEGTSGGASRVYYAGNEKLATTSTGVDVTGTVTADTFSFANWTVTESGGSLYFATGGTNKMKLDASGNLQVVGNVESNATIS